MGDFFNRQPWKDAVGVDGEGDLPGGQQQRLHSVGKRERWRLKEQGKKGAADIGRRMAEVNTKKGFR